MAQQSEDDHQKSKKTTNYKLIILLVAVVFLVLLAIFLFLTYRNDKDDSQSQQAKKAAQIAEKRYKDINEQQLAEEDYVSYQISLRGYAEGYSRAKDYSSTERILKKILNDVPADKIEAETYYDLSQLYKNLGNQDEYKKYMKLFIARLKVEDRTQDVEYYEKKLKEVE